MLQPGHYYQPTSPIHSSPHVEYHHTAVLVQAHSVVLVRVPEGTDVEAVRADIEANANPRKWVCVEAEATWVKTSGQYVVMVMSTADMAAAIEANFNTVFGG